MQRIIVEILKECNHKNHNEQEVQFVAHKWKIDGDFASGDATFALAYNVADKGAVSSFQVGGGAMHTGWRRCAGPLILIGHFPQKSPMNSGSFAERMVRMLALFARWRWVVRCIQGGKDALDVSL